MNAAFLVVVLALVWAAITSSFSGLNLLFGGLIGGLAVSLLRDAVQDRGVLRKIRSILSLAGLFLRELMASAVSVALLVIRPDLRKRLRPALVAVPLTVTSDAEIALLANLITLTPGTLSVDVSPDKRHLYIHALTMDDAETLISGIADGFEKKVQEVFR